MTYHAGFLYMADGFGNPVELINEARTANILMEQGASSTPELLHVEPFFGCEALGYEPCAMDANGAVTEWTLLDLDLLAAPWVSQSPASQEGYGFAITEWTGLDGAHHSRAVIPRGMGGARFGPQTDTHRTMSLNILVHGSTERGLNHLFRWLETSFTSACRCETSSLWLREFCPVGTTEGDLEEGLIRVDDVVLLQGPQWIEPPWEGGGCYLRALNIILGVGDPCMYRVPSAAAETAVTTGTPPDAVGADIVPAGCDTFRSTGHRVTATVEPPVVGLVSPIVTLSSSLEVNGATRKVLPAIRIFGLLDDANDDAVLPCLQRRSGMIVVDNLPSGYEIVVDTATGAAQVRDLYGDRIWIDGGLYIQPSVDYDPTFEGSRAISFGWCAGAFVVVEPAQVGPAASPLGVASADLVDGWDVTIQLVSRVGCA